ncbi:MAG: nuclear transport factor 2 family protein [Gammaproteobacteria bacterium]|nr:nuclear transport factor 2 family protein [Gammaproteobacteria bacterium]
MNDEAGPADLAAIERLNADFRYYLDCGDADAFSALFTEDAYYSNGAREARGREAIAAFIIARSAAGPRTTRHLYSGLRVDFQSQDCAGATSVWLSFAFNGEPPALMAEPFLVADMEDVYRRVAGQWLIAERRITPVFRNPRVPPPGGTP